VPQKLPVLPTIKPPCWRSKEPSAAQGSKVYQLAVRSGEHKYLSEDEKKQLDALTNAFSHAHEFSTAWADASERVRHRFFKTVLNREKPGRADDGRFTMVSCSGVDEGSA